MSERDFDFSDIVATQLRPSAPPEEPKDDFDFSDVYADSSTKTESSKFIGRMFDRLGLQRGGTRGFMEGLVSAPVNLLETMVRTSPLLNPNRDADPLYRETKEAFNESVSAIGKGASGLVRNPTTIPEAAGRMVEGLVDGMIRNPIDLIWGFDTKQGISWLQTGKGLSTTWTPIGDELTPEERYTKARSLGGMVAGLLVGFKAETAISSGLAGYKATLGGKVLRDAARQPNPELVAGVLSANKTSQRQLVNILNNNDVPLWLRPAAVRRPLGGAVGGVAGGVTSGVVEFETPAEQMAGAVAYGLIGLPLGAAFSSVFRGVYRADAPENIARGAAKLHQSRFLNYTPDDTMMQILLRAENIMETKDLSAAIAMDFIGEKIVRKNKDGTPVAYGVGAQVIPKVDNPARVMDVVTTQGRDDLQTYVHKRDDDSLFDVLIAPKDFDGGAFFTRTGYLEGEQVSFGGDGMFVIEAAQIPKGKRQFELTLRHLISNKKQVTGLKDVLHLTDRSLTNTLFMQKRLVTDVDMIDEAQGFSKGSNTLEKDAFSSQKGYHDEVDGELRYLMKKELLREGGDWIVRDVTAGNVATPSPPGVSLPTDIKLTKGLNVIKTEGAEEGFDQGVIVFMADNGDLVANTTWTTKELGGKPVRGSLETYSSRHVPEDVRRKAVDLLVQKRSEMGIRQSFSTLSPGGAQYVARIVNVTREGRILTTMGRSTPEQAADTFFRDFLDFVGFTRNDINIRPDEIIGAAVAYPGAFHQPLRGQPGLSFPALGAKTEVFRGTRKIKYDERRFVNARDDIVTEEQAARSIAAGEPPEVARYNKLPIDMREVSFNDAFNAYVSVRGVRPEIAPALRNLFQFKTGQLLLGDTNALKKFYDPVQLPLLKNVAMDIRKTLEDVAARPQEDWTTRTTARLDEAVGVPKHRDIRAGEISGAVDELRRRLNIFENRIFQIEHPEAHPLAADDRLWVQQKMDEMVKLRADLAKDLYHVANSNGFYPERQPGGIIKLRDSETQSLLPPAFLDEDSAIRWMKESGQAKGIDLDGGGNNLVPPEAVMGPLLPPQTPRPYEIPFEFPQNSRVSELMRRINKVPVITAKRDFTIALDGTFKTKFFSEVYHPSQVSAMEFHAKQRQVLELAKPLEEHLLKHKIPLDRRKLIGAALETMSPDEIITKLFKSRPLTDAEIHHARVLVHDEIDVNKVYSYRRRVQELDDEYTQKFAGKDIGDDMKQKLQDELRGKIVAVQDEMVMDAGHLSAAQTFDEIVKQPLDKVRLDGVTRLAKAWMNKDAALSRPAFFKHHKFTPAEMAAVDMAEKAYAATGASFKVSDTYTYYLNHYKTEGFIPNTRGSLFERTLANKGEVEAAEFASKMIRSGELDVYQTDPLFALISYMRAGSKETPLSNGKSFNETIAEAINAAGKELESIPPGAPRIAASRVISEYLNNLRGFPDVTDELLRAEAPFSKMMDETGVLAEKADAPLRRDFINTLIAAQSGAMLGFRVMQGIRDYESFAKTYIAKLGRARFNNGLRLAFKRDSDGVMMLERLARDGTVPGLDILAFASEAETAAAFAGEKNRFADAIFGTARAGFKVSGQHNAFAVSHAVAYLDTKDVATKVLAQLRDGKISKRQAYNELSMNSYDIPVAETFDNLVVLGKWEDATQFLAQTTGAETAHLFGHANQPFGWMSKVGRLGGQFGSWAVQNRGFIMRLAGRGTASERASAMARYAAVEASTFMAGKLFGFNMSGWYLAPGILFGGGPFLSLQETVGKMTGQWGPAEQERAFSIRRGKIPLVSQFTPGAYAFSDYYQAWELAKDRFGVAPVLGKALGFGVDRSQRSILDELTNQRPSLSR